MTAAVTRTPHPVLYLVPGGGGSPSPLTGGPGRRVRCAPARPSASAVGPAQRRASGVGSAQRSSAAGPAQPLPAVAAEVAARVLGTLFAPVATRVADRFTDRAPLPARRGRPEPWAAAIAFLLAEEGRLFAYDSRTTRTSLARELGSSLPALRRRAATVRATLLPSDLDLPDPDPDLD